MANNFRPDKLNKFVSVSWAVGAVAILDAIEEPNGLPGDSSTDYILDQAAQVKILKPIERTDFVGTETTAPIIHAFDSDPHPTGTPEYVDQPTGSYTGVLPTKEQFATGFLFHMKTKVRPTENGGWYENWIINLAKLRSALKASSPNPDPFSLDMSLQRVYFSAYDGDARPYKTATWTIRIYAIGIDKFAADPDTGQILPTRPVLPISVAQLVVPLAQEGDPGFPALKKTLMTIPEHALYDGTTASFAAP
jgi:hypothetical protein